MALNYRGLFVKSEKEMNQKFIWRSSVQGEENAPLVEPTFAKVLSP